MHADASSCEGIEGHKVDRQGAGSFLPRLPLQDDPRPSRPSLRPVCRSLFAHACRAVRAPRKRKTGRPELIVRPMGSTASRSRFKIEASSRTKPRSQAPSSDDLSGGCNQSTSEPHVRLAIAPVIALARSEATKAAKSATSSRVGRRFSSVPVAARPASISPTVVPARSAKPLKTWPVWDVAAASGIASGRRQMTRMPLGPSSLARMRENASMAAPSTTHGRNQRRTARRVTRFCDCRSMARLLGDAASQPDSSHSPSRRPHRGRLLPGNH